MFDKVVGTAPLGGWVPSCQRSHFGRLALQLWLHTPSTLRSVFSSASTASVFVSAFAASVFSSMLLQHLGSALCFCSICVQLCFCSICVKSSFTTRQQLLLQRRATFETHMCINAHDNSAPPRDDPLYQASPALTQDDLLLHVANQQLPHGGPLHQQRRASTNCCSSHGLAQRCSIYAAHGS